MYSQVLQIHASVWPTTSNLDHQCNTQPLDTTPQTTILPEDPRCWTREDVTVWLWNMQKQHNLPAIEPHRFHMNGKALCLMNVDMFVQRVPLGGKLLYKDFQMRLTKALYSSLTSHQTH